MRTGLLLLVIAAVLGGLVGTLMLRDPGYVLIAYAGRVMETSLWFAFALLIVLYAVLRCIVFIAARLVRGKASSEPGARNEANAAPNVRPCGDCCCTRKAGGRRRRNCLSRRDSVLRCPSSTICTRQGRPTNSGTRPSAMRCWPAPGNPRRMPRPPCSSHEPNCRWPGNSGKNAGPRFSNCAKSRPDIAGCSTCCGNAMSIFRTGGHWLNCCPSCGKPGRSMPRWSRRWSAAPGRTGSNAADYAQTWQHLPKELKRDPELTAARARRLVDSG